MTLVRHIIEKSSPSALAEAIVAKIKEYPKAYLEPYFNQPRDSIRMRIRNGEMVCTFQCVLTYEEDDKK